MAWLIRRWLWVLVALALPLGAAAQSPLPGATLAEHESAEEGASPAEVEALRSPEAVREMVARLSDEEVRALLLERLDAQASQTPDPGQDELAAVANLALQTVTGFTGALGWAFEVAPNLAVGIGKAFGRFYSQRGTGGTALVLGLFALALGAGWAARRAVRLGCGLVFQPAQSIPREAPLARHILHHGGRAFRLGIEASAFVGAFWGVIWLLAQRGPEAPTPDDYLVLSFLLMDPVFNAVAMGVIVRLLLSPGAAERRLIHMDDATARLLARGLVIFAVIAGLRAYALNFVGGHGVALADLRLGFWLTLALYGWLFALMWRARAGLTQSLIGSVGEVTETEHRFAEVYPYIAMALIAVFWALTEIFVGLELWGLLDGRLPLTLLILIFAPAADRMIRALVYRASPPVEGSGTGALRAFAKTRRSYIRVGRVVMLFLVIWLLERIWNTSLTSMAGAGVGAQLAARMLEAVLTLGVGYLVLEAVAIWINGMLAREQGPEVDEDEPGGGEGGGTGGSRLATVLPLVSFALQATILVITLLTALSALGIDTTPLLAGAGIVGIAVGFGAQTLVADVVSGIFFLVDDAFRTGEYVEVEGTVGTVEKISVRSLRLRHHEGRVHTIPFGQIPKLTNYSRDWVIMKLRFTVPFDTDLQKVKKIFKKIGAEMMADARFTDDFLQPFKSQGVLEVDDVGIVIRGKFMAKPGRQWTLRKEIYQRVQQAFEENGLQFARKEVRVRLDHNPDHLTEDQKQQIAAAASEAAERPALPGPGKTDEPR